MRIQSSNAHISINIYLILVTTLLLFTLLLILSISQTSAENDSLSIFIDTTDIDIQPNRKDNIALIFGNATLNTANQNHHNYNATGFLQIVMEFPWNYSVNPSILSFTYEKTTAFIVWLHIPYMQPAGQFLIDIIGHIVLHNSSTYLNAEDRISITIQPIHKLRILGLFNAEYQYLSHEDHILHLILVNNGNSRESISIHLKSDNNSIELIGYSDLTDLDYSFSKEALNINSGEAKHILLFVTFSTNISLVNEIEIILINNENIILLEYNYFVLVIDDINASEDQVNNAQTIIIICVILVSVVILMILYWWRMSRSGY